MKSWFRSEDVLAVLLGLLVIALSLATLAGWNLLGWSVAVKEWADPAKALVPSSPAFAGLTGLGALAATFVFLLAVLSAGAVFLGVRPARFAGRFAVLFALAFACWVAGHNAHLAANPVVSCGYWSPDHHTVVADADATWLADDARADVWRRISETPEPMGYDPSPIWPNGPDDDGFAVIALRPYRIVARAAGQPPRVWTRPTR